MMMFKNARLKLTFWYVAIIMVVSLSFSAFVYENVIAEVNRGFRIRSLRTSFYTDNYLVDDNAIYEEIRRRVIIQLGIVNALIFLGSAAAGYLLAGKTLRPIEIVMEDQKRFIGDASHELRTPLTSMRTEIEVNLRDKSLTLTNAKDLLKSNLEEVNKMQTLSNYLLSLSKYEEGGQKLNKSKVYLNKLVEKVSLRLLNHTKEKQISIINKVPSIFTYANETSIEELISILLDNAVKYGKEKGKVKVTAKESKHWVTFSVLDDGPGIKSADLPYIFNRFYRADMSRTKEKIDGYGLGLSIAKSIVDIHSGKIEVTSELGEGTKFTVMLPK